MKTLRDILEASLLADIEDTLNYDVNKHILQLILNSKSKEEFNEYCKDLLNIVIPAESEKDLVNNVACFVSGVTFLGKTSYFIDIGKFGKKPYYKIQFIYGKVDVERLHKSIDIKHVVDRKDAVFGILPKEIIIKDLF